MSWEAVNSTHYSILATIVTEVSHYSNLIVEVGFIDDIM